MSDIILVANGVGEAIPVAGAAAVSHYNLKSVLLTNATSSQVEMSLAGQFTDIISNEEFLSWKALFGSALSSVPSVIVEAIATGKLKNVEEEIAKKFPGTSLMAIKLKGGASACAEQSLKADLIKEAQEVKASYERDLLK